MLNKTRERIKRWWFSTWCRGILLTQPIQSRDSQLRIVSMVSHFDLMMYLVAVKSLYYHLGEGQVVIVNDGTLTSKDIELLNMHLSPSQLVTVTDIKCGRCPRGGTWERLLLISDHVKQNYVIQLDSDTLTLNHISEVIDAIKKNHSFTLGTGMGRQILSMEEICGRMKAFNSEHVQVVAEQNFDKLCNYDQLKYVRGCSGFAGFAKGSFSRLEIEEFSEEMEKILGKIWFNWGSEQVTSNLIIANSPQSYVLPYPKYSNFTPEIPYEQNSFLHFIGTHRFKKGVYVRMANDIVKKLRGATSSTPYRTRHIRRQTL